MKTRLYKIELGKIYKSHLIEYPSTTFFQHNNLNQEQIITLRNKLPHDVVMIMLKNKVFANMSKKIEWFELINIASGPTMMLCAHSNESFILGNRLLLEEKGCFCLGGFLKGKMYHADILMVMLATQTNALEDLISMIDMKMSLNSLDQVNTYITKILDTKYANNKSIT